MADYTILVGIAAMVLGFIWLKYNNDHEPKETITEISPKVPAVLVQDGVTVEILEEIESDTVLGVDRRKGTIL